jgi:hypothetical protein
VSHQCNQEQSIKNLEIRLAVAESDIYTVKCDIKDVKNDIRDIKKDIQAQTRWLIGLLITSLLSIVIAMMKN